MINFIHDILKDPAEYATVLLFTGVMLLMWAALCASGWVSVRTGRRPRKLWCALTALVLGLIGVCSQLPFSMEGPDFHVSFDFRWLFVAPLMLGVAGIVLYWRTRNQSVA